jgi:hypothetical protein
VNKREFITLVGGAAVAWPLAARTDGDPQPKAILGHFGCYPRLTGSVCIARKTRATMNTLQTVATIPAFMAGSMLWLRRRDDAAVGALAFGGIGFCLISRTTLTA